MNIKLKGLFRAMVCTGFTSGKMALISYTLFQFRYCEYTVRYIACLQQMLSVKNSSVFRIGYAARRKYRMHDYKNVLQEKVMYKRAYLLFGIAVAFFFPLISFAGGPIHGSKAVGMGTAFVAVADDPSAIMYNPAGLTQLKGTRTYGGMTLINPSTSYKSPSGRSEDTEFQIFFPPHFYISSEGKGDLNFGLGIFSPFGIGGRKWDEEGLTRYSSVESEIGTVTINPAVAYRLTPRLSIGLGLDYMISRMNAENRIDQSMLGSGDAELSLKGIGAGWGYNMGLLFIADEQLSFGVAYRSRIRVNHRGDLKIKKIAPALEPLFGDARFKTDMSTAADFPEAVSFGMAYRPARKWTLSAEAEWIGWSSFDKTEIKLKREIAAAGITDSSTSLDWNDIWTLKAGAEYKMNDRLFLRGGYVYVETPVPEHTLTAAQPDSKQHNFSVGLGYKKDKFILDLVYLAAFYEDRRVNNAILSGKYENFLHYFALSLGRSF
jgi:long-chain fatty acid transport protein